MDTNRNDSPVRRLAFSAAALAVLICAAAPSFAESRPERSLAGIAIFAPGSEVTHKFGNPSQILVGGVPPAVFTPGTAAAGAGAPGAAAPAPAAPSPGGGLGSAIAGLLPGFSSVAGEGDSAGAPSAPGFPGGASGFPGGASGIPGGASGFPGAAASTAPVKLPVTLVYDRANGGSLEFTISPDKRVVQVRETGYAGAYGTSRGIRLGMPYSAVIARYGYPEDTEISGSIINIDYKDTLHCGFQFLDQKLVGIIVASPD